MFDYRNLLWNPLPILSLISRLSKQGKFFVSLLLTINSSLLFWVSGCYTSAEGRDEGWLGNGDGPSTEDLRSRRHQNVPRFIPSSPQEMISRYNKAKSNPGYSRLRETAKVIGTWDDHDYGLNDAGKEFTHKVANQRLLLGFLDDPQHSLRMVFIHLIHLVLTISKLRLYY